MLDHLWSSLFSVKVLIAVQLLLHLSFLLLFLRMVWPLLRKPGTTVKLSNFAGVLWLWVLRLALILAERLPRVNYTDLTTFWDNGFLHFLVFMHHFVSALMYASILRMTFQVKRTPFTVSQE